MNRLKPLYIVYMYYPDHSNKESYHVLIDETWPAASHMPMCWHDTREVSDACCKLLKEDKRELWKSMHDELAAKREADAYK